MLNLCSIAPHPSSLSFLSLSASRMHAWLPSFLQLMVALIQKISALIKAILFTKHEDRAILCERAATEVHQSTHTSVEESAFIPTSASSFKAKLDCAPLMEGLLNLLYGHLIDKLNEKNVKAP
ncbi:hypothetical protein PNK_2402 [Candidatus Protochlamydia naegleriophila]|uniref:Uncharacterized protein n=1 Tax=Candidatus Protochlamydia naegleriophila TaxID=389348 RepID=A0A0U5JFY4_9BACT|nr:hypothetical protein [Candidatus Protochlamydia naegleriophila]CUI17997.1 hypothetical protein PNK_2402 [Candidatus Protochlamydia naegleriophila]